MPSLQYPRSDTQRYEALRHAKRRAEKVDPSEQILSPATLAVLNSLCERWEKEVSERDFAAGEQSEASQHLANIGSTLGTYLSHFLQVLNMGIIRGEFEAVERAKFRLPTSQDTLPTLQSEADLITWAERLIEGEALRKAEGLAPIHHPTIEQVQEQYTAFKEARLTRNEAQDIANQEAGDVQALRSEVEDFVRLDLWYEITGTFRKEEPARQRRLARQWGVRYRFQKGEEPLEGEMVDEAENDVVSVEG